MAPASEKRLRQQVIFLYIFTILLAASMVMVFMTIFAAVGAQLRLKKSEHTIYQSHFRWIIYSIGILWIGIMAAPVLHGAISIGVLIWVIIRLIKGLIAVIQGRPITNPKALI